MCTQDKKTIELDLPKMKPIFRVHSEVRQLLETDFHWEAIEFCRKYDGTDNELRLETVWVKRT